MKIELLYFQGCPNHEAFVPHLRELLIGAGVPAEIELVEVPDDRTAQAVGFLGSPTLRVDGHDVEPGAEQRADFGLKCRLYRTDGGYAGMPTDAWVAAALSRASAT